ncbi:MAG: transaldolase, partial [Bdellovibrionales bacterium]|nr:transaldolase [Bdellovibrionales bacterium]
RTNGADGYASIEVSPFLANDTKGTIEAGERLWAALSRPNIMIKVPATEEGIPAIEALLTKGINVNVTLIFSVPVYSQVANAYLQALETRKAQGQDIKAIASVASFFVSRVDAICEKDAEKHGILESTYAPLLGKVGIANSKLAYAQFLELFSARRFKELESKGAQVQRPLWASVGTKNPDFSKLLYVEALAGKHTVNTMPPETLEVLLEGSNVHDALADGFEEASSIVSQVQSLGIAFDALLHELQLAGVKSFADSYQSLLDSIGAKLAALAA